MSEKVLGFQAKDSYFHRSYVKRFWKVPCDELVPVVSVEWLEKYCHENEYWNSENLVFEELGNLLLAAEKEAKKK